MEGKRSNTHTPKTHTNSLFLTPFARYQKLLGFHFPYRVLFREQAHGEPFFVYISIEDNKEWFPMGLLPSADDRTGGRKMYLVSVLSLPQSFSPMSLLPPTQYFFFVVLSLSFAIILQNEESYFGNLKLKLQIFSILVSAWQLLLI